MSEKRKGGEAKGPAEKKEKVNATADQLLAFMDEVPPSELRDAIKGEIKSDPLFCARMAQIFPLEKRKRLTKHNHCLRCHQHLVLGTKSPQKCIIEHSGQEKSDPYESDWYEWDCCGKGYSIADCSYHEMPTGPETCWKSQHAVKWADLSMQSDEDEGDEGPSKKLDLKPCSNPKCIKIYNNQGDSDDDEEEQDES
eukprot:jgi/Mesvir1/3912/Mv19855-RA.1